MSDVPNDGERRRLLCPEVRKLIDVSVEPDIPGAFRQGVDAVPSACSNVQNTPCGGFGEMRLQSLNVGSSSHQALEHVIDPWACHQKANQQRGHGETQRAIRSIDSQSTRSRCVT